MKIKAHAKINLALDVIQKREDGYHDLEMIMVPITLHDLLYIEKIEKGIVIASNSKIMPTDERNIMYQVASIIIEEYKIEQGIKIFVYKHIPTQAGLAGGSADGAAVIKAMNHIFKLAMSVEDMAAIGKRVGADLPFCIYEKKALVEGIGEKLQFIEPTFESFILLVKPKKGISTKKAFTNIVIDHTKHGNCQVMKRGMEQNDYHCVIQNLYNSLETPSIDMVPEIQEIKDTLTALGFDGTLMSGSGSCVFGMTRKKEILEKGYQYFKNKHMFVRKSEIVNTIEEDI